MSDAKKTPSPAAESKAQDHEKTPASTEAATGAGAPQTEELGGPKGPEPTRFGDWERNGRCSDF